MSGNVWCVAPDVDEVDIVVGPNSAKLMLKRQLSYGEQRAVDTAGIRAIGGMKPARGGDASPELTLDWARQACARALAWIADWTLTNGAGAKLPVTRETIEAFRPEVMEAVENAITAHIEKQEAIRKNAPAGEPKSSETSG